MHNIHLLKNMIQVKHHLLPGIRFGESMVFKLPFKGLYGIGLSDISGEPIPHGWCYIRK